MKKVFLVLLALMMTVSGTLYAGAEEVDKAYDGYVYLTVERNTIGQGLALAPTKVGYFEGESLADISERGLGDMSVFTGDMSSYYIETIVDGGEPQGWTISDVPTDIMNALGGEDYFDERQVPTELSADDYTAYTGWMLTVDNYSINDYAGSVKYGEDTSDGLHFKNGSTVRLQYTAYGWGEDIGCGFGYMPFETTNTFPDRSELIAKIGEINAYGTSQNYGSAYTEAVKLLNTWEITEDEISKALADIKIAESGHIYEYKSNGDGTHTITCKDCGITETADCSFDSNNVCEKCKCHKTVSIYGDVNGDGEVDIQDATAVQKYTIRMIDLTDEQKETVLVDGATKVNIKIVTRIQKYVNNALKETNLGTQFVKYS